ncbi:MAG: c-type cytochrome [Myxococcales bacterium]|nr:c-type cytochrome [Myxococcales bacterium]
MLHRTFPRSRIAKSPPAVPRAARILPLVLLQLIGTLGCSSEDAEPSSQVDDGEWLPGGDTTNTLLGGKNAFTMPAENIQPEHESLFYSGNAFFNQAWVQAPSSTDARDGLGPLFNARSCAACHFKDGRGSPPLAADEGFVGLLLRLSVPGEDEHGGPKGDPNYGGPLQPCVIGDVPAEGTPSVSYREQGGSYADGESYSLAVPEYTIDALAYGPLADSVLVSPRVAPAVIGLGLLETIPESRLQELADPDDADGDGISGRINYVWDAERGELAVGRMGWKSEQPSVRLQSAGAFNGDIGITTSIFTQQDCSSTQAECLAATPGGSPELGDDLLDRVQLYGRLLAVPARVAYDEKRVLQGKQLFHDAGCAGCHTPRHTTGDSDLPELAYQTIWPYTDLLLHDMGPELSDERPVFDAAGAEWRTPPLWGIGRYPDVNGHQQLLHDGRARGVAEAILWHGGEAAASREAFKGLSREERDALVNFVESL